ncbi:MAG: hypothetical protein IKF16_10160 [Lachnospiraceae bacterium]|nr:hypothetical protein [Lachnospiraceae bacterium]
MNFIKAFIMEHPIISVLVAGALLNRAEDAFYMHLAQKNGTSYRGHNVSYGLEKKTDIPEVKQDESGSNS